MLKNLVTAFLSISTDYICRKPVGSGCLPTLSVENARDDCNRKVRAASRRTNSIFLGSLGQEEPFGIAN